MRRRSFLAALGLGGLGASPLLAPMAFTATGQVKPDLQPSAAPLKPGDWRALRALFPLTHDYVQLATFLLASHPKPVSDAIERHRRAFDKNPADYWHAHFQTIDNEIAQSAADYMGGRAEQIALTDSTTMGLAMVYGGIALTAGDEILQTTHDHYSTDMSIHYGAQRTGAKVRKIKLYDDPAKAQRGDILERLQDGISRRTKVVAVTWVHSSTGVKLPIRAMADVIAKANARRKASQQILFCVDGVHGFGIENENISEMGCDYFVAGTHKWIFGPRGTGVIWGSERAWAQNQPIVPSFSASYDVWLGRTSQAQVPVGEHMSPGGFHSFEHRWALPEAFKLHLQLGKQNVQARIHELNRLTKSGLAAMPHVTLHTPMSEDLSSGLVCFDVTGMQPDVVVAKLHEKGIIMSATPYRNSHARFAPSLLNSEKDIEIALSEIAALA